MRRLQREKVPLLELRGILTVAMLAAIAGIAVAYKAEIDATLAWLDRWSDRPPSTGFTVGVLAVVTAGWFGLWLRRWIRSRAPRR